jgi:predicted RNase H-like nuclease (RuvC/YqgF family)
MDHSAKPTKKPKPRTSGALSNARIQHMLDARDERITELQQELDAARKRIAELERELAAAHTAN